MKNLTLTCLLLLTLSSHGQVIRIDRSDTTIHVVHDYFSYNHWRMYPATSAIYVPPCVYRIVPPDNFGHDFVESYDFSRADPYQLIEQNDKYGIVNAGDTLIIPIQYDSLVRLTASNPKVFIAKKASKFGLLNAKNEIVIPFEYDGIFLLTNGQYGGLLSSCLRLEKDGKIGLMRVDGSLELSCKYDFIDTRCEQTDCPKRSLQYYVGVDGQFGYINRDESVAIKLEYEALDARGFSSLIKAKNNGKVGLIDTSGNFILPQVYENLYHEYMAQYPHLTSFKKDGKWGLMNGAYSDMKIVLENKFDSVMCYPEFENHFIIINDSKWGLADTNGKVVIPAQFQEIQAMQDGTFAYKKQGKWGFMNENGGIHCAARYDAIYENNKNWCLVTSDGGFGFCKTSGVQIAAPIYEAPYWDDYIHWEELISSGHIALAKRDSNDECKMGAIDSTGRVLLPFEYDCLDELIYNFGTALIAVKDGKEVIINGEGKEVYLGDYDEIERRGNWKEYFFTKKGDKIGLVSPEGKLLTKPKYDRIDSFWWGHEQDDATLFFLIEENSKFGLLDSNGAIALEPIYDGLALNDNDIVELVAESEVKLYNLKTKTYESFSALNGFQFNGHVGVFNGWGGAAFFIDSAGNRINAETYDHIWSLDNDLGHFQTKKADRFGISDANGKALFDPKFAKIKFWDGEFGTGKLGNHYCFFNALGDTLVGYRYEKVKGVYDDFVCVKIKGKFGVVNKKGKTVIKPTLQAKLNFEMLKEFGLTTILENYKVGLIDTEMKRILPANYDNIRIVTVFGKSYAMVNLKERIELYNAEGNIISKKTFSSWKQTDEGELFLFDDLHWFRLSKEGELLESTK